jgi:cytochrome b561
MLNNTATAWGFVSKTLHWLAAALILFLLIHGWIMVGLPREMRFGNYSWHASFGYATLALMIVRLLWRWINAVPALPAGAARWEVTAARAGHAGLYLLIFAASFSGWALAGAMRRPLDATLFGFITVPNIVTDRALHDQLESAHRLFAWTLAALIVIHVVGALYHLWLKKDAKQDMPLSHSKQVACDNVAP